MLKKTLRFAQKIVLTTYITQSFTERSRGLFALAPLNENQGLLISPCRGIHTFFMPYAIDLVYLDSTFTIIKTVSHVVPNRMSWRYNAYSTLELKSGEVSRLGLSAGMTGFIEL